MSKEPTQERVRELFEYHKDGRLIHQRKGGGLYPGKIAGCLSKDSGYRLVSVDRRLCREHRLVWIWHNGSIPNGLEVDHIDNNRSNNALHNLRLATHQQNIWNGRRRSNNTTKVIGVKFRKDTQRWTARIYVDGTEYNLGCFDTKKEAIAARRVAEDKHFGEFAPVYNKTFTDS